MRIPNGWTFAEAATVPSAFLTAWQALVETARLRRGERVLIHAGTGGVGMAAIAITFCFTVWTYCSRMSKASRWSRSSVTL